MQSCSSRTVLALAGLVLLIRIPSVRSLTQGHCRQDASLRRDCGTEGIDNTECVSRGCCFDENAAEPQCFYSLANFPVCTKKGELLIVITKDVTVPHLNLSSVHLIEGRGKQCEAKNSSTDVVIFKFPVMECGTTQRIEGGYVVYETDVLAARQVLNGHQGSITRDSTFRLHVQCKYNGNQETDLSLEVYTHPPPLPAADEGILQLQLRIAKGRGYQTWYMKQDYPILRTLRDAVFVEVRILNRTDSSLVLILNHCWATPKSDPKNKVQWNVLVNGCPYAGDNYKTLPISVHSTPDLQFPTHHKRFAVKTFVFLTGNSNKPLSGEVYLHCTAEVCSTARQHSCSTSCSRKKRRSADDGEHMLVTAEGPIVFIQDRVTAAMMNPEEEGVGGIAASQVLPAVAAGFALLSMAMLTLTVALCKVKRPHGVRYESSSSDL